MDDSVDYRFGVSEFTTWPWSFEQDLDAYIAHGLDAIEVCEFKLNKDDYAPQLRRIADAGLEVSSVQTSVHSLFPDSLAPEPLQPADRLHHIMQSMQRIAPHVPPETPFVLITGAAPHGDCHHVCEYTVDTLRRLGDYAASLGVRLAFEPLNPRLFNTDTALWGLDRALELVSHIDHPAVGLCVDTWNIFETPAVERVIEACAGKIFLVQVSDFRNPRSNADRVCLGDGEIALVPMLKAIRRAGYTGPYVLEIFSSEFLPDSLWKADMNVVIDRNIVAFDREWQASEVPA